MTNMFNFSETEKVKTKKCDLALVIIPRICCDLNLCTTRQYFLLVNENGIGMD